MSTRIVSVPVARLPRWIDGFAERHGGSSQRLTDGVLHLRSNDHGTRLHVMLRAGSPGVPRDRGAAGT